MRRQRREHGVERVVGELEVSVALVLLDGPAHADRLAVLVEVADLEIATDVLVVGRDG